MEEKQQVKSTIENGSFVYVGECGNDFINNQLLLFANDDEAIKFYSDYEAKVYKLLSDGEYLSRECVYNPTELSKGVIL